MPTFAFWNIDENVKPDAIAALAHEAQADVLVLAENKWPVGILLRALNNGVNRFYFPDSGNSTRLTIFTRFLADKSTLVRDTYGLAIRHYQFPLGESIIFVAAHLPSKLRKKTEDQILSATRVARFIREAETGIGHSRTILIGDLNMNPFEVGIVGSEGLHAVMDRRIAAGGSRVVAGEEYHFFYNPMWATFGDRDSSPPGTYYYNSGAEVNYFWNVFDQVLLRPSLINYMADDKGVTVVTELQGKSLLNVTGRPDRTAMSDHLPIVCRLREIMEVSNVS